MTTTSSQPSPSPARRDVIQIKKSWAVMGLAALALIAAGGAALGFALAGDQAGGVSQPDVTSQQPSIGPASARVVIMEFSDFYCKYCKEFHDQTFQALMDKYGTQVRFVYFDFPTTGGQQAAEAASCAKEQGAYWDYHNALFSEPFAYSSLDQFTSLASSLSLDKDQFYDCVSTGKYRDEVLSDYQLGVSYGVRATPSFVINGVLLIGAQPLSAFEQVIDQQLGS